MSTKLKTFEVGIDFEVLRLEIQAEDAQSAKEIAAQMVSSNKEYQTPEYWVGYVDDDKGNELL